MPKPTKGPRIGGSPAHQRIILANLATQLFEHGKITTTVTRAKRVQPLAEHLITKAKRGDLASIRVVAKTITNKDVLYTLFHDIAPVLAEREGGYTRVTKLGTRKGDGAPIAQIEIITEAVVKKVKSTKKAAPVGAAATKTEAVVAAESVDEAVEATEAAAAEIEASADEVDETAEAATADATDDADDVATEVADEADAEAADVAEDAKAD